MKQTNLSSFGKCANAEAAPGCEQLRLLPVGLFLPPVDRVHSGFQQTCESWCCEGTHGSPSGQSVWSRYNSPFWWL